MIVATLIFLFLLTGLGYYFSRDLFAPFVIAPAVWGGILLLYLITPPHLFPISIPSVLLFGYSVSLSLQYSQQPTSTMHLNGRKMPSQTSGLFTSI